MKNKLMLVALALVCLIPVSVVAKPRDERGCDPRRDRHCQQVPEGGSGAIYLVGAGLTCLGAIAIRSRSLTSNQS
jgi:hypothetical protein